MLLPAFQAYAKDEAVEVRQAAVYGLGVLAAHASEAVFDASGQQQSAELLMALVEAPNAFDDDNASASDNAVAALGKLCKRSEAIAAAALQRWLAKLPLWTDKEEARGVHKMLVDMCEATNTHLLGASHERLPDVICIFGQVRERWSPLPAVPPSRGGYPSLSSPPLLSCCLIGQVLETDVLDDETPGRITNLLKQVHAGLPHVLQSLPSHPKFAALDAQQRGALERALSAT